MAGLYVARTLLRSKLFLFLKSNKVFPFKVVMGKIYFYFYPEYLFILNRSFYHSIYILIK